MSSAALANRQVNKRKREAGGYKFDDDDKDKEPVAIDSALIDQTLSKSPGSKELNGHELASEALMAQGSQSPHAAHLQEATPIQGHFGDQMAGRAEFLGQQGAGANQAKPAVGTEEWHRIRRDNHKEVERRRRETINEGITELAKIVPGCEKNKGSILQRAVQYIQQLKDNETSNIEKWTLEKLLTEQTIAELSSSNEKLKVEVERAWREADAWKKTCASAGIKKKQGE
ncbi:uncharacterized protein V1510DRAFT_422562 [Dipodascopsis tothii]|uniref:uncharacterized protein n=1 Tax=Dipodascopsis tothii TaxID=44089 RepID=UPI0034CE7E97